MIQFQRSAVVPYSQAAMYNLVNDVKTYPEFLPWCSQAKVLEESSDEMLAMIEVSVAGARKSFSTRNRLLPHSKIEMQHVDGPFKSLTGVWSFTEAPTGCQVALDLAFEVESSIKSVFFGIFFHKAAEKLVSAFCERAHQLYGKK